MSDEAPAQLSTGTDSTSYDALLRRYKASEALNDKYKKTIALFKERTANIPALIAKYHAKEEECKAQQLRLQESDSVVADLKRALDKAPKKSSTAENTAVKSLRGKLEKEVEQRKEAAAELKACKQDLKQLQSSLTSERKKTSQLAEERDRLSEIVDDLRPLVREQGAELAALTERVKAIEATRPQPFLQRSGGSEAAPLSTTSSLDACHERSEGAAQQPVWAARLLHEVQDIRAAQMATAQAHTSVRAELNRWQALFQAFGGGAARPAPYLAPPLAPLAQPLSALHPSLPVEQHGSAFYGQPPRGAVQPHARHAAGSSDVTALAPIPTSEHGSDESGAHWDVQVCARLASAPAGAGPGSVATGSSLRRARRSGGDGVDAAREIVDGGSCGHDSPQQSCDGNAAPEPQQPLPSSSKRAAAPDPGAAQAPKRSRTAGVAPRRVSAAPAEAPAAPDGAGATEGGGSQQATRAGGRRPMLPPPAPVPAPLLAAPTAVVMERPTAPAPRSYRRVPAARQGTGDLPKRQYMQLGSGQGKSTRVRGTGFFITSRDEQAAYRQLMSDSAEPSGLADELAAACERADAAEAANGGVAAAAHDVGDCGGPQPHSGKLRTAGEIEALFDDDVDEDDRASGDAAAAPAPTASGERCAGGALPMPDRSLELHVSARDHERPAAAACLAVAPSLAPGLASRVVAVRREAGAVAPLAPDDEARSWPAEGYMTRVVEELRTDGALQKAVARCAAAPLSIDAVCGVLAEALADAVATAGPVSLTWSAVVSCLQGDKARGMPTSAAVSGHCPDRSDAPAAAGGFLSPLLSYTCDSAGTFVGQLLQLVYKLSLVQALKGQQTLLLEGTPPDREPASVCRACARRLSPALASALSSCTDAFTAEGDSHSVAASTAAFARVFMVSSMCACLAAEGDSEGLGSCTAALLAAVAGTVPHVAPAALAAAVLGAVVADPAGMRCETQCDDATPSSATSPALLTLHALLPSLAERCRPDAASAERSRVLEPISGALDTLQRTLPSAVDDGEPCADRVLSVCAGAFATLVQLTSGEPRVTDPSGPSALLTEAAALQSKLVSFAAEGDGGGVDASPRSESSSSGSSGPSGSGSGDSEDSDADSRDCSSLHLASASAGLRSAASVQRAVCSAGPRDQDGHQARAGAGNEAAVRAIGAWGEDVVAATQLAAVAVGWQRTAEVLLLQVAWPSLQALAPQTTAPARAAKGVIVTACKCLVSMIGALSAGDDVAQVFVDDFTEILNYSM